MQLLNYSNSVMGIREILFVLGQILILQDIDRAVATLCHHIISLYYWQFGWGQGFNVWKFCGQACENPRMGWIPFLWSLNGCLLTRFSNNGGTNLILRKWVGLYPYNGCELDTVDTLSGSSMLVKHIKYQGDRHSVRYHSNTHSQERFW